MAHANKLQIVMRFLATMDFAAREIVDEAEDRLQRSHYLELRRITCTCADGVLSLKGHVSSYYLRQMAHAAVNGITGVRQVDNRLEVLPSRAIRQHLPRAWQLSIQSD